MSKDSWDEFEFAEDVDTPSATPPATKPVRQGGVRWSLISSLILVAAITILAAQNTQRVTVNFLGWEGRAPLITIILATGLVAVLLDEAVGYFWRRRRRKTIAEREDLERLRSERLSD